MTTDARIFVDTNIFLFALNKKSPWYQLARAKLDSLENDGHSIVLSSQVLREMYAVMTRPDWMPKPLEVNEAVATLETVEQRYLVVPETVATQVILFELLRNYQVAGRQVHDANIVATALTHNIPTLLTHNAHDFKRYADRLQLLVLKYE